MKDIQREVKALEVAMQVATDIQDKPYAYAVARIQEALLGNTEIVEQHKADGHWYIHWFPTGQTRGIFMVTPEGDIQCYLLPISASPILVKKFLADFNTRDYRIQTQWRVFTPDSGAVYLRHGVDEIPLGAMEVGSLPRKILVQLQCYLKNLSHGETV